MKSSNVVSLWSWESWLGKSTIFLGTLAFGSCYPVAIRLSKQGQDSYPYMFPTALLMAKFIMLIWYSFNLYYEVPPQTVQYHKASEDSPSIQDDDEYGERQMEGETRKDFWTKLKLSLWALPNIILTLLCDVMTFKAMQYVTVASYTLLVQTTTMWIVVAQFMFLNKVISCPQALAVTLVTMGVVGFQFMVLEMKNPAEDGEEADSEWDPLIMFGTGLVLFRGFLKACNMVYCEWFLQRGLKELTFYEKQTAISFWFVISSFGLVLTSNGQEWLFEGRSFFDGYAYQTWGYIFLAAGLGMWYYLMYKYLDALMCGINSMCCLPCGIFLDVIIFGTGLSTPQVIFAAIIILGSFQYNLLKGYIKSE